MNLHRPTVRSLVFSLVAVLAASASMALTIPSGAAHGEEMIRRTVVDTPATSSWVTQVIGHGWSRLYTSSSAQLELQGDDDAFTLSASNEVDYATFRLFFGVPPFDGQHAMEVGQTYPMDSGESGCEQDAGSFTVRDITADLQRVWIDYRTRCHAGDPWTTGEVHIGEPAGAGYDVAPSHLTWAPQPLGMPRRPMPVTVLNTEAAPLRVTGIEAHDPIEVVSSTCDQPVPAGLFCRFWVAFTPSQEGVLTDNLIIETDRGSREVAVDASTEPATSRSVTDSGVRSPSAVSAAKRRSSPLRAAVSPTGATRAHIEFAHDGYSAGLKNYDAGPDQISGFSGNESGLEFWANMSDDVGGFFWVEAPVGQVLLPGTVLRLAQDDSAEAGDMGADIDQSTCMVASGSDGTATVKEVAYDLEGNLSRISLTFVQHCWADYVVRGAVAWNALDGLPDLPWLTPSTTTGGAPASPLPTSVSLRRGRAAAHARTVLLSGRLQTPRTASHARRTVILQRRDRQGRWHRTGRIRTNPSGVFRARLPMRSKLIVRATFVGTDRLSQSHSHLVRIARRRAPVRRGQ